MRGILTALYLIIASILSEMSVMRKILLAIVLVIFSSQAINAEQHNHDNDHDQQHHKKDQLGFFVSFERLTF